MPIYYNNNANPSAVVFNGTSLSSVWAGSGGSFQEVWGTTPPTPPPHPQTIGLQTLMLNNGSGLYFRNMTYNGIVAWRNPDTGQVEAYTMEYLGDVTFETTFAQGRQIGPNYDNPNSSYVWHPSEDGLSYSFYGDVPSGYGFYRAQSTSSTSSIAFDVYQNESGQLRPEDLVVMNLGTVVKFSDTGGTGAADAVFTTAPTGHYWPVLTRSSGWIYQNTGALYISI